MKLVEKKKLENSTVSLEVTVTAEEFEAACARSYKKNIGKMKINGFRPGKAPRHIVEKLYGPEVFYEDAVDDTCYLAFSEAALEAGIEPVDRPSIELKGTVSKEGYTFVATVAVKPEVTLGEYKGVKVDRIVSTVTDADVDVELKKYQERYSRLVPVTDRASALGDTVVIDYEGFTGGVAFEGGKDENHNLKLGSGQFIPGFEDQLVGKNAGEDVEVNVKFPDEYHSDELAGKEAVFKVKVKEVKTTELPEINDEFVKDISEFDTLDAFKADLKAKMQKSRDEESDNFVVDRIISIVVENMKAEIPAVMYDNELQNIMSEYDQRLRQQGMDLDSYMQYLGQNADDFKKLFQPQAEARVKSRLALEAVAVAEKIAVSEEEINDEYNRLADMYMAPVESLKMYIPEADMRKDLSVSKALEFLKAHAEITDKAAEDVKPAKKPAAKKSTAKKPAAKKTAAKETEEKAE